MNKKNKLILIGSLLIGFIIVCALWSFFFIEMNSVDMMLKNRFLPPSWQHPMGTDQNGSDILLQILLGAQVSLLIAFSVVTINMCLGLIIGSVAGYLGGLVDIIIMRIIDTIYAFPGFLLILSIAAVMQSSSLGQLIFVLTLTGWASFARMVRGEFLRLKKQDYVLSAEALGASHLRKIIFYIWPNLLGPLTVQSSFAMAAVIIVESSLSFLGIGVPPTTPTWGSLLNSGRYFLLEAPHISLFPGLALLIIVTGFNLLGDGLRDKFDPKNNP